MFTQPRMYKAINKHPHVLDQYSDKLMKEGVMNDQEYQVCNFSDAQFLKDLTLVFDTHNLNG